MWEKRRISKTEAKTAFEQLEVDDLVPKNLNNQDEVIRNTLLASIDLIIEEFDRNNINFDSYMFDLRVGLEIYETLNNHFGFSTRIATQDDVWRYLSLKLIPDLVYKRYGLNPSRYYSLTRRIWLKVIWWYIHLSWQGSKELTFEILEKNTTDTIAQLVERTGPNGYRVDLTRQIMSDFYFDHKDQSNSSRTLLFRRIMKLSTARLKLVEPSLMINGNKEYTKGLFEYFVTTSEVSK